MHALAKALKSTFDSEYCAIGTVIDGIAEDSAIVYKISTDKQRAKEQADELKSVRSADANGEDTLVSIALKSTLDYSIFRKESVSNSKNFEHYINILDSRLFENSLVIPIRDNERNNIGFIQLINVNNRIDYERYISPHKESLLGLVQIIINNQKKQYELIRKENLLKDANFYNTMQDKRDDVDELLDSIMNYFSDQFNAAVISFRTPIFNSYQLAPLFFLRRVFVHSSIGEEKKSELMTHYNTGRLVKSEMDMKGLARLRCDDQGKILESESDTDFSKYGLDLDNITLIIPIFRDFDHKCINPKRPKKLFCKAYEHYNCKDRFKRLYGIFRLRIATTALSNNKNYQSQHFKHNERTDRLAYLSKQISLLLNSIVDRYENKSLETFQNELKNTSFTKIKDFDERCVSIIRKAAHAKVCSIYRYNDKKELLSLSATTTKIIIFKVDGERQYFKTSRIFNSCFIHKKADNNILSWVLRKQEESQEQKELNEKHSICLYNIMDSKSHESPFIEFVSKKSANGQESAMAVPMIKRDGSCAGVVLLLGKENEDKNNNKNHSISTVYWEHDVKHVGFIVNILTRISESDTERLTFLSQLSHELLLPVTELVYDNDLTVNTYQRDRDSFTKQELISKIKTNIDRNMFFKYIISDTEFTYSSIERNTDYNFVMYNNPQKILLEAIRYLEKEAHAKGLNIITYISKMPPMLFDKERMMQVFLNLLKNAIRYADNYTQIDISYNERDDSFHEIRIANVGIGIQKEEQESIFELFHRGKAAIKKVPQGTGMGLYIVRDIMRAHGGDCYVRRLDNPTEFAITLPFKKSTINH